MRRNQPPAFPLDARPSGRTLQLRCERLGERVQVGRARPEGRGEQLEVGLAHPAAGSLVDAPSRTYVRTIQWPPQWEPTSSSSTAPGSTTSKTSRSGSLGTP